MSVTQRDYYEALGVSRGATGDQIKSAYRKKALRYHPDRNPGDPAAHQRFKEAAEAYEVLSNPETRTLYDAYGHRGVEGAHTRGLSTFEDIFNTFSDIFSDSIFSGLFGFRGARGFTKGRSLECDVSVTLEEVLTGVSKTVTIRRMEACDACNGTGAKAGTGPTSCSYCRGTGRVEHAQGFLVLRTTCPRCNGSGRIIEKPCRTCRGKGRYPRDVGIDVSVPPGIEDGMQLGLAGQGEAGESGGARGDLFCNVRVEEHPVFKRQGANVFCEVPLRFAQAVLGTKVRVPSLDGEHQLKIPRGTDSGKTFRLRGLGLPILGGRGRGDQIVQVFIKTPKRPTPRQVQLIKEFDEAEFEQSKRDSYEEIRH